MRTGTAELPLHGGKCPPWLFEKMKELGLAIIEVIVGEYGPGEVLRRLSDPFWFQALGCVLGFDWHSSGLTTTVCGALKEGARKRGKDLGVFIAGGKGKTSRRTPQEIEAAAEAAGVGAAGPRLVYASRMAAKVDNAALQDGYRLYHHTFFFTAEGRWAVIQQGMHETRPLARRYHWLGESVGDFVCEPHAGICGEQGGQVLNMVARESEAARQASAVMGREKPERVAAEYRRILESDLVLPHAHAVPGASYLERALLNVYEEQPRSFEQLLGLPGVGPKTVRALALISEVVHGARPSFRDPVRYSFAHGGKDGHPYPVDRDGYRRSIEILRGALSAARVGYYDKLRALRRLAALAP